MRLGIALWVLGLLALGPASPAQEPRAEVECPTCKGKGRAAVECPACGGEGSVACGLCNLAWSALARLSDQDETVSDEKLIELRESLRKARASFEVLDKRMKRIREPGRVACPSSCVAGTPLGRGGECKYCEAKGSLPCGACSRKGEFRCAFCSARKRIDLACRDCGGSGRLPDPAAIDPAGREDCSWCSDGTRGCGDCVGGQSASVCRACNGAKAAACSRCIGTGVAPCRMCAATGIRLDMSSLPPSSRACGDCGKSGRVECSDCVQGKVRCKECGGAGKLDARCVTCGGNSKRPCPGCFRGAFRHWEVAAEILSKSDPEAAIACLEIARSRIGPYFDRRAKTVAESDEERAAIEEDREAAQKRVDGRIAVLRKPAR